MYRIAEAAGMPKRVLQAYSTFLEQLLVYNTVMGGMGTPYRRRCGIPQGCPFSMAMVALLMRGWVIAMRGYTGVKATILADDVLLIATGVNMAKSLAGTINETHRFLHALGARVAPEKSYNFSTHAPTKKWLEDTWWHHIQAKIEVLKDFRYLGSHINVGLSCKSATLEARLEKSYSTA